MYCAQSGPVCLPAPVVFVYVFVPRPVPGEFLPAAGAAFWITWALLTDRPA